MEERVAGEHVVAVGEQPLVDLHLLRVRRVQVVPRIGPAPRRAQASDAQLRAVGIGERLEPVELIDVVTGDDDRDLERAEVGRSKVVHRPPGRVVRADAAHRVVRRRVKTVEGDLDVEVFHRGEAPSLLGVDERPVGRELDPDVVGDGVLDEFEEVAANHRLAPADVDVEHLQVAQLVEHPLGLGGGQLAVVTLTRRRQAVDAGQVAGVGQFPGEADRCVEARLELGDQGFNAHG